MGERRRSTGTFDVRRTTGSDEVVDRLFAYATLRQGQSARSLIANQVARCVKASTSGAIYVFPMGYAGLVEARDQASEVAPEQASAQPGFQANAQPSAPKRVIGEVLWLTELAATFGLLDAYEGPDFARVLIRVKLETGDLIWSWVYALADTEAIRHGTLIEHGDWVRYLAEHG